MLPPRTPFSRCAVLFAALLVGAAAPVATPVSLQSNGGTRTETLARRLAAEDIASARSRGDTPLVLTGRAALGGPQPALLVQLQSPGECGSAGCSTSVFSFENGKWQRVLDSATGKLLVSARKTKGRNDILADEDHFIWTGSAYESLDPAPALNLQPHRRKR